MSRAQLQQDIVNTLTLAGQDWMQGSAALNAAFANMLTFLETTKLTQELVRRLGQGGTFVSELKQ